MTKLNYAFIISILCTLLGFILLEEVGTTLYAGFLAVGGCIASFVLGIGSLVEYDGNR